MKRKVITGLVLALFVTILFSMVFNVAPADDELNLKHEIPFPGMMLVYTEQEIGVRSWDPEWGKGKEVDVRTVTFLPSLEPGCIWMRDSLDPEENSLYSGVWEFSEGEIDVSTREIIQPPVVYYSQFLIPTDIDIGEDIRIGLPPGVGEGLRVTVVGTQMISVMGKEVYAWVLEEHSPQHIYTMFYCKKTGILLSGQGAWFNEDGTPIYSWTILLTDTNAQIG